MMLIRERMGTNRCMAVAKLFVMGYFGTPKLLMQNPSTLLYDAHR